MISDGWKEREIPASVCCPERGLLYVLRKRFLFDVEVFLVGFHSVFEE